MATTLATLIELVNEQLENRTHKGTAEVVADGVLMEWNVAPIGYTVYSDPDWLVLLNGMEQTINTDYTMNFDTGVCTFSTLPASGDSLKWYFNYASWSDAQVTEAINAGIQSLFPSIYVETLVEEAADGETDEFAMDPLVEFVRSYDWKSSGDTRYTKKRSRDFEIFRDGDAKVVSFFTPPSEGTLRIHAISRPVPLATTADDLEGDALIPDRCQHPIISYACYYLLTQKTAPRTRGDVAVITQGLGTLSPRQMNDAANAFYLRYQMQLASIKMPPWSMR